MKKLLALLMCLAATSHAVDVTTTSVYDYQSGAKPCERGGCMGTVCGEPGANPITYDCKPQAQFACVAYAKCGRSSAGTCGWQAYDQAIYDRCTKMAVAGTLDKIPSAAVSATTPNNVDYAIPVKPIN